MIAQYLSRTPLSQADTGLCFYCNVRMEPSLRGGTQTARTRTKDHILCAHLGGRRTEQPRTARQKHKPPKLVGNVRWSCARCNNRRNDLYHCCALLMLVLMDEAAGIVLSPVWEARQARVAAGRALSRNISLSNRHAKRLMRIGYF